MKLKRMMIILISIIMLTGCSSSGGSNDAEPEPPPPPPVVVPPVPPPEPLPEPPPLRVCLEWDGVIHPDLAGYRMYYGKVSEQYDIDFEIEESITDVCIEDESYFVKGASYYFVATAYSLSEESGYSNEVVWRP